MLAAIVTVYIVLGVLYESFIHPITILSTLPSAGVGALLALLIAGDDLDVIAIIGIILLIGIVKKNAIMMIDFALVAEREEGKPPREAIHQACLLRFRPILMTTMAALLGALPLMLGTGTGSELRRPLGVAIVGGLIVSQVLTLFTTPVIYLMFDRLAARMSPTRDRNGWPMATRAGGTAMNLSAPFIAPSGGDHAADHRHRARRRCSRSSSCRSRRCRRWISRPSRCTAQLPGASPDTVATSVADAAGAPSRADRRRDRDDLHQLGRVRRASCCSSASTATSTAPRATCRRRSTPRAPTCRPALRSNPTYRKVNPADAPILILALTSKTLTRGQIYDAATNVLPQRLSQVDGIGQVHHRRRARCRRCASS